MSDVAVVYVSRTGNCRTLAAKLAAGLGGTAFEIVDLQDRAGALGFIKAGGAAASGTASPIRDPGVELGPVRTVVLVQPMWAFSLCPPMRTWLDAHRSELAGKRIGLLVSHLGTNPESIRKKFEKEFWPLDAFAAIAERLPEEAKQAKLIDFLSLLAGPAGGRPPQA